MVARGLEKGMRDVVFADGARLPFRDGTFDAVTTNHVLHLIPDWRRALSEAHRVLRPAGVYFSPFEQHREATPTDRHREPAKRPGNTSPEPGTPDRHCPSPVPPPPVARAPRARW